MTTDELLSAITAELSAIGAATDLGLISQEGERVSAILMIDDRRFCLSLEPKPADMDVSGWLSERPRKLDQDQQLPRARSYDRSAVLPCLPATRAVAQLVKLSPTSIAGESREERRRRVLGNKVNPPEALGPPAAQFAT